MDTRRMENQHCLAPKGHLSSELTIEKSSKVLQSQFLVDIFENLTKDVGMY